MIVSAIAAATVEDHDDSDGDDAEPTVSRL